MPTTVFTKKGFLEFIEKQVGEGDVIIFSNHVTGSLSISEKSGLKVGHVFSGKTFKRKDVGHIAYGNTRSLGILIAKKGTLSEETITALEQAIKNEG